MAKKISITLSGKDDDTAYVALPGYLPQPGIVYKTLQLHQLVKEYAGPMVNMDFNNEGKLIGIEILA